jgi:hypothetical protein
MTSARKPTDRLAAARRVAELIGLRAEDPRRLTAQDYRNAGAKYGIEPAALNAFADVESSGGGFADGGRAVILFEPHIFSRETRGQWDGLAQIVRTDGDVTIKCEISYPKWIPLKGVQPEKTVLHVYQLSQLERWGLLAFAAELDFEAALKACSWGAYQILGRNHAVLGYPTAWHFVVALHAGEHAHLDAAIAYLMSRDVLGNMRKGDWRPVIKAWNGDGQVDRYLKLFLARLEQRRRAYA